MAHDRDILKPKLIAARRAGRTLARAAAAVGVHVATVCRWQAADPTFAEAMRVAERDHRRAAFAARPIARPRVRWRADCPACGGRVRVRTTANRLRFWRCGRWPICRWASWRPRYPTDCPACSGPRFWSHARMSAGCEACGLRILAL